MSKSVIVIATCLMLLAPLGLSAQVWDPDLRLTEEGSDPWLPSVAVSGSNVHVVWEDNRDGNYEIYYKRSTDGGTSWGTDTRLTEDAKESRFPSVAVSGDTVHVVWEDNRDGNYEIYYKRSTDGGANWGTDTRLTNYVYASVDPSVAVSGSNVHVVWVDFRVANSEIYYKRSTDGGTNWYTHTRLTNDGSRSEYPSVAVSGSNVHVVWQDNRDGNYEIYYKRSTDGGANWGTDTRLTNNSSSSECPSVAVSGSNVHVVWYDWRGGYEIYYKRSTDGGTSWGTDTRLNNFAHVSAFPSVAASGSNVHVVWQDWRDGNDEIYYKRSTDGGTSWGLDTRLTEDAKESRLPSVAVSGSAIHVVWADTRDGGWEIYYKRGGEMQPDNLVKNSDESDYTGDDVYNDDGTDQTKEQTVAPGDTAVYHIRIENDGDVSDTVAVTGSGSVDDWTVYYYDALTDGTDITSDVTGSGWSIEDLDPGAYTEIRLEVIPDDSLPGDSTFDVLVTSTSERDDTKLDAVGASTTTRLIYQPDNQIKNSDETEYIGDDIYNVDGTNQTSLQNVGAGNTAIYHIKVENDGNTADTFIVTGTASSALWDVKYFDALTGGADITSLVTLPTLGWSTGELAIGEFTEIRVEITPVSASEGSTFDVCIVSTSKIDDTRKDVVKAITTVGTGVEEEAVPVPLVYSLDVSPLSSGKGCAISYTLHQAGNVTLSVYDVSGALVENLADGHMPSGNHTSTWKGNAGVYFVRLETPDRVLTAKLIVVN